MKQHLLKSGFGWIASAFIAAATVTTHAQESAHNYPSRPIHLIVPYGAGGSTDLMARRLATYLGQQLDQQVVVENKPGASTTIAASYVARSNPDGHTLLLGDTATFAYNKFLFPQAQYDPKESFDPIAITSLGSMVLVSGSKGDIDSLPTLIRKIKEDPTRLNYASAGLGTPPHMFMESFLQALGGARVSHVPYKGELPGVNDMISGSIDFMFVGPRTAKTLSEAGRIRPLGWGMSQRSADMPNLPAVAEFVPGFEQVLWQGIVAPKGTPRPVIDKLNEALRAAFATPEFQDWLKEQAVGITYRISTPEEFAEQITVEQEKAQKVIEAARISIEQSR